MTIKVGDRLPAGTLLRMGESGPETVDMAALAQGRVVIFGLPGAYTGTCSTAHLPSFVRNADTFRDKGVARIVCLTVNDPFVARAWAEEAGAGAARVEVLADADGSVTRALGLSFDAPKVGLHGRCKRCAMIVEDGTVRHFALEDSPGVCTVTAGEALLEVL